MKETIKHFLKKAGIYYCLQGNYRNLLGKIDILSTRVQYASQKGNGFVCNFCNHQYKKFVPRYPSHEDAPALNKYQVVGGDGENVFCPYCGSTCRERLVLYFLQNKVDCQNKRVLHLSPEKKLFDFLNKQANVITADIEPGFYKLIDKQVMFSDARKLPFDNESFDMVIANHIMEHIPEDTIAMKEILRVLKPGGRAIVQIPFSEKIAATIEDPFINDPKKQSALFGQNDHVRIYNMHDYLQRLTSAGFTVKYISPDAFADAKIFALQPAEGFVDCVKL